MTDTEDIKTSESAEALATPATGEDVAAGGRMAWPGGFSGAYKTPATACSGFPVHACRCVFFQARP